LASKAKIATKMDLMKIWLVLTKILVVGNPGPRNQPIKTGIRINSGITTIFRILI
jgi:hypothetical protein